MKRILESIEHSKVKSLTEEGCPAITRANLYKIEGHEFIAISFTLLFMSNHPTNDEFVRYLKGKYIYKRVWTIKLTTLKKSLVNLGIAF